jgi:hypothetical protein
MRERRVALLVVAATVAGWGTGCGGASEVGGRALGPPPSAPRKPLVERVLIVTWDGVRWQEIFDGTDARLGARAGVAARDGRALAPALWRLGEEGVAVGGDGAPMVASGPAYVSLPGYREIFTGRRDEECTSNDCGALEEATLADEVRAAGGEVAVVASWETIEQAVASEPAAVAISTGRHGGAGRARLRDGDAGVARLLDEAAGRDAWPGRWDYRRDADTAEIALRVLEARRPHLMVVGLGDADEHAHRADYRRYVEAIAAADAALGRLVDGLERAGLRDGTLVVVTTDHGRARSFSDHGWGAAAARVWMVASGPGVVRRGRVALDEERRLADIAPTLRVLLDLPRDRSPRAGRPIVEILPALVASRISR